MDQAVFKRELKPDEQYSHISIDPQLGESAYVHNFGYEWTIIDGLSNREVLNSNVFQLFLLPKNFFKGKTVVDVGCGNGRVGSIVATSAQSYIGCDLSEAIYAFPQHTTKPDFFKLVRASGTDLPLNDNVTDVTLSVGVVHHMDDYEKGLDELIRITKPGGIILIYLYWQGLKPRQNINALAKAIPSESMYDMMKYLSNGLDAWRETDNFYGTELAKLLYYTPSATQEWSTHQWFDAITPEYHWCLCDWLLERCQELGLRCDTIVGGAYRIHVT